jgi:hypothetical protein
MSSSHPVTKLWKESLVKLLCWERYYSARKFLVQRVTRWSLDCVVVVVVGMSMVWYRRLVRKS